MACGILFAACAGETIDRSASGVTDDTEVVNTFAPGETVLPSTTTLPAGTTLVTPTTTPADSTSSSTTTTTTTIDGAVESTSTTTTTVPSGAPDAGISWACATSVRLGPFEMSVSAPENCLSRAGLVWTSTQKVFVGGMEFRPVAPQAMVTFDPLNAHIHATGYQAVGSIFGGDLIVDEGVIDWSFQYSPSQSSAPGWAMPIRSDVIKTSTIGRLPGLSDVASYPKQPVNGFPDYTVVTEGSVTQLAGSVPSLATPGVVFTLEQVGLQKIPAYTLSLPTQLIQKIAGLTVEAALTLEPVEREGALGMAVYGKLKLPGVFQGYDGELGIFWPVNGSVRLEKLFVKIPEIDLAVVRLKGVDLKYSLGENLWAGKVTVLFGPGADALGFGGTVVIKDGELKEIGVVVQGLPLNIYGVASINSLGGTLKLDPFGIKAISTLGVGPFVPNIGNVATIDGVITIDTDELSVAGEGTVGKIMIGNLELKGMRVGEMKVAYYWDGLASISGKGELFLDDKKEWGVGVSLRGAANATDLSLGGDATLSLGFVKLTGTSAVSTKGVIACGVFKGLWFDDVRLGLSKDWVEPVWRLRNSDCNSKEYEVPVKAENGSTEMGAGRNAAGADPDGSTGAGTLDVSVADGQKMVTFAIDAASDSATVTGPDGTVIEVTGLEQSSTSDPVNPRWMVFHEPGDTISYVVVGKPAGGTWRVATSGTTAPNVTASVVDAASAAKDAATPVLEPTQVGAPLTAIAEDTAGAGNDSRSILEIVLVLVVLLAGLGVTLFILQRRNDAS
ncbi:unannotated protein [freshwater metagenome]|uniref:Unannotated protein n=1 Tax=freshwater metagenome TaxID=449393 RepID=A0A6J6H7W9_9ZZZZ